MAKVLRVKKGYNPNSSSSGAETSSEIAGILRNSSNETSNILKSASGSSTSQSFFPSLVSHPVEAITYTIAGIIGVLVTFTSAKKLYFRIKKNSKNKEEGKDDEKIPKKKNDDKNEDSQEKKSKNKSSKKKK